MVVRVGGGGLIWEISVNATALEPEIKIIGVQTAQYASMAAALAGEDATCGGDTLAEGIAVKAVSETAISILAALGIGVMVVDEAAIERAIYAYLVGLKTLAEGAGAAGLAARVERFRRKLLAEKGDLPTVMA